MKSWLKSLITGIVILAVLLTVWRLFGGDVGGFFVAVWGFVYTIIEGLSTIFMQIGKMFGLG